MTHQTIFTLKQQSQIEEMLLILGLTPTAKKTTQGVLMYYFNNSQEGISAVSLCRDYIPFTFITTYNKINADKPIYQLFPISNQFSVFFDFLYSFVKNHSKALTNIPETVANPFSIQYSNEQLDLMWKMLEWCAWNLWKGSGKGIQKPFLIDGVMCIYTMIDGIKELITIDELIYFISFKTQFKWNRTFPLDSRSPINPQYELLDFNQLFAKIFQYESLLSKNFAKDVKGNFLITLK